MSIKTALSGGVAGSAGAIAFEDTALVESVRKGDMQAFASLIAKYQDRVFNMVYRMSRSREDAEELTQEAFLTALKKMSQFRGHSGFYTWIFRIAANLVISYSRRSGRIRFQSLSSSEEFTETLAGKSNGDPQAIVVAAERQARVMEALEELDEEMRLVVILRDIEDMDYNMISEVLEVPMGTVKSRLHRGRCELKDKLSDLVD